MQEAIDNQESNPLDADMHQINLNLFVIQQLILPPHPSHVHWPRKKGKACQSPACSIIRVNIKLGMKPTYS